MRRVNVLASGSPLRARYDAVVVGGGHNGLVAAAYLARAGQSVLLLERNPALGGATCSATIFPGMDARLSRYSYLVSLLPRSIVRDLGLRFSWRRRAVASCTPYRRNGRASALLLSNVDPARSRSSLLALTTDDDWRGHRELMSLERALARLVWPSLLQPLRSRREWTASLRTDLERRAWDALVERPLGETLERLIRDDTLRGLIFTDAKIGLFTHPHDETLLQNRCFLLHVIGQGTGEWDVPVGGMGALVKALAGAATAAGAQLVCAAPVEALHLGRGKHSVVFRHGEREHTVEAGRVLVNAGPQVLARLLGAEYSPSPGDEGSVCKVNMLLRRLPRMRIEGITPEDAFTGTFHLDESYSSTTGSYAQAAAGQVPDRPPAEIYCHTLTDASILAPRLRDAGYHTLTLFGLDMPRRLFEPAAHDGGTGTEIATAGDGPSAVPSLATTCDGPHNAIKQEVLRRYLQNLNSYLAEPIDDCLARDADGNPCVEIKSPRDLEDELALNLGNIFHAAPSWFFADDEATGRWGVETPFERVYVCGSSALRGGGVSGIPGHNAARCILDELRAAS